MSSGVGTALSARVAVLGALELQIDGTPVPVRSLKQRALLTHLALAVGQHVSIDTLVDDLWPSAPPRDPMHALQAQVSRLRALLPAGCIEHGPAGYRLVPDQVVVDVTEFADLCERARAAMDADEPGRAAGLLDRALGLWRGPLLAELPDAAGLGPRLVRLRELRRSAMAERVDAYLATGHADRVIGDLESALHDDPLQERTWHQLMLALYRSGRQPEAMKAYRRAHTSFVDELGVEPGADLRRLHEQILHRGPSAEQESWILDLPPPRSPDDPPADSPATLTFTARTAELAAIRRAWAESRSELRLVTVTGEPGIGKTRLVTEFAERQRSAGSRVLYGHCDQDLSTPYQPLAQMLQVDAPHLGSAAELGRHLAELARVFPSIADGDRPAAQVPSPPAVAYPPSTDPQTQLHHTFDAVAAWLELISADGPVVLVIDDAQWADEQTLMLLSHLLRTPRRLHVLILVTVRSPTSVLPEFSQRALLRQSTMVTHLGLTALEGGEVAELLAEEVTRISAGDPPPEAVTDWVQAASGGNPLLVVELARWIATQAGPDLPGSDDSGPLTWGVREVIDARLEPLPPTVYALLQDAAVLGAQFDPATLQTLTAAPVSEFDATLRGAADAGLIRESAGSTRFTFCHEIVRTALYQSLPSYTRASRHRLAAGAIEAAHRADASGVYSVLAHHYSRAHEPDCDRQAVHYLALAGEQAFERRAPSVAATHFRQALRLLPQGSAHQERCDLLIWLGRTQARLADPGFRETLLRAADIALQIEDYDRLGTAAVANHRGWWSSTADIDHERVATIETALANTPPARRRRRVQLLTAWARENVRDPERRSEVLSRSEAALAEAEQLGDELLLANVLSNRYSVLYAAFADPTECLRINERLLQIAHRRGDHGLRLNAAIGMAQSAITLGELAIADRYLSQAAQLAEMLHQPSRVWLVRGWQAMRQAMRGQLTEAAEQVQLTYDLGRQTNQPDAPTWYAGQQFTLHLLLGRLPEFLAHAQGQVEQYARGIPSWRAAFALVLAQVGDHAQANAILDEFAADGASALPQDMLWLHGMAYLSLACAELDRTDLAPLLYEELAPYEGLLANNGTIDAGPVDLHLGSLALQAGEHQIGREHLQRALRLCRRIDAPVWRRRAQELLDASA